MGEWSWWSGLLVAVLVGVDERVLLAIKGLSEFPFFSLFFDEERFGLNIRCLSFSLWIPALCLLPLLFGSTKVMYGEGEQRE